MFSLARIFMNARPEFNLACPMPIADYPNVLLAHGGGGKLMHQLFGKLFVPTFRNDLLEAQHDASVFTVGGQRMALTTDSYVVRPMFFPAMEPPSRVKVQLAPKANW